MLRIYMLSFVILAFINCKQPEILNGEIVAMMTGKRDVVERPDLDYCPKYKGYTVAATIAPSDSIHRPLTEISGIATSRTQRYKKGDVLWVHNDTEEQEAKITAVSALNGERIQTYTLDGIQGTDFEDISMGPCVFMPGDCIYLADVGDNKARESSGKQGRESIYIHKFPEPTLPDATTPHSLESGISIIVTFEMNFTDSINNIEFADCEAIFVDPVGDSNGGEAGDIYFLTKWNDTDHTNTSLYKYPYSEQGNYKYSLKKQTNEIPLSNITRADISPDGKTIAVGTYKKTYFWSRNDDQSVIESFDQGRCNFYMDMPQELKCFQLEALAFNGDGSKLYEVSENRFCEEYEIGIHQTMLK